MIFSIFSVAKKKSYKDQARRTKLINDATLSKNDIKCGELARYYSYTIVLMPNFISFVSGVMTRLLIVTLLYVNINVI